MFLPSVEASFPPMPPGAPLPPPGAPTPGILHLFAFKPERTEHLSRFTQAVMRGPSPLAPWQRELIAAFTSAENACPFWLGSHAAVAAQLLGDEGLIRAVVADYRTAPISEQDRALFAFVAKVNAAPNAVRQEDVDEVMRAGWSEEAVYDAITVCALFRFYNTWVDANGVADMPDAGYRASGVRLATQGYARED